MSDKKRIEKLEYDLKALQLLLNNHIGDGGNAHTLSEDGLAGFLSSEEKFMILNSSGRRTWVTGLDFNTIAPGRYEGNKMKNGPISETNDGVLEFDVSEGANGRKQIFCTKSSSGQNWTKIVHSNGSVSQNWTTTAKSQFRFERLEPSSNLTETQKSKLNASYYILNINNICDVVELRIILNKGFIEQGSTSFLTIIDKFPDEMKGNIGDFRTFPSVASPSDESKKISLGFTSSAFDRMVIGFNSALDYSNEAYLIKIFYMKPPSINLQ